MTDEDAELRDLLGTLSPLARDHLRDELIVRYSAEEGSPGFLIFKMNEDETEILDGSGVGLLDEG